MENILKAIEFVEQLEEKYNLPIENARQLKEQLDDFHVYMPLIGRFSAGKSALINTLLYDGFELCRENISVETAIPTEVFYGEEEFACICGIEKEKITIEEYIGRQENLTIDSTKTVKLQLKCDNLKKIPSIALVDMPGLDSGHEVHDRAVFQYIQNSMAYVLVFPADELTIPRSMEPILSNLNTFDMPMCVVITKGNRISGREKQSEVELKDSLSRYFPGRQIEVFITEKEDGYLGGFEEYLSRIEEKAESIGAEYYQKHLEPEITRVSNYLQSQLRCMDLSLSELDDEQTRLQEDIEELNGRVEKEIETFSAQIPYMVQEVAEDVQVALVQRLEELVVEALHGANVQTTVNGIVQATLISSYQNRITARIKKTLAGVPDIIGAVGADYVSPVLVNTENFCGKGVSGFPGFLGGGSTQSNAVPAVLGIAAVAAVLVGVGALIAKRKKEEQRREAERKIRQQLSTEVFPNIDRRIREKVQMDLERILIEMKQVVDKDVKTQVTALQKSLEEVVARKKEGEEAKSQERTVYEDEWAYLEEVRQSVARR